MEEFIRTPTKISGPLTEAEKEAIIANAKKWADNAMRTDPVNPETLVPAIKNLYTAANLAEPVVAVVPSPIVMKYAGGIASAILSLLGKERIPVDSTRPIMVGTITGLATVKAVNEVTGLNLKAQLVETVGTDKEALVRQYSARFPAYLSEDFIRGCMDHWWRAYQGGNMWSSSIDYLTAFRDVLGLDLPEYEKFKYWEQAALEGGYRWMHSEFCIVSDRPEVFKVDAANRLHCDDGPSLAFRDGSEAYHIHGVEVDKDVVLHPELITLEQIDECDNTEIKRVLLERFGYERYVKEAGLELVDECGEDHPIEGLRTAKLYKDTDDIVFLDMRNCCFEPDGTQKRYVFRIDGDAYNGRAGHDCVAAMASTWRNAAGELVFKSPKDYAPEFEG